MTHLEFLNKNLYRKYPFQKTALTNNEIGTECFVSLRVNQCYGLLTKFFFKVLSNVNGVFYGNFYGVTVADDEILLGSFCDKIITSGQVLTLRQVDGVAAGTLTVGSIEAFTENFYWELDSISGGVEPTCVGYFKRPNVTKLLVHPRYNGADAPLITSSAKTLIGDVSITGSGITIGVAGQDISPVVNNPEQIRGKGTRSLCAGNCLSPVIYSINEVEPDVNGNINIVGELPIVITTDGLTGVIGVTSPTLDREMLCQGSAPNQPPLVQSNTYYTPLIEALKTEWQTWEQYQ